MPQHIHKTATRVPCMCKCSMSRTLSTIEELVAVSGIKDDMDVSSSPSESRRIYHAPQPNSPPKKRVSQEWIIVTGWSAF